MLRLRENLPSDESWLREALGIWDDDNLTTIPMGAWRDCADQAGVIVGQVVLSVDMAWDRSKVHIGVCGPRADGRRQVEVVDVDELGRDRSVDRTTWLVGRVAAAAREWDAPVVIASRSHASALVPLLQAEGVTVDEITELPQACGHFYDSVVARTLVHLDDGLTSVVKAAQRKPGESFVFTRKGDVDISPLYAALLALWGWTCRHASGDILQAVW
jgi:hypothetical protein